MAVLAQHLILSQQQSLDGTHQRAALTGEVRGGLALEGGLEQVAGTDADTEGEGLLLGLACSVLVDGIRAVQSAALAEHGAQRRARTLGSHHDDIHVLGRNDTCAVAPVDSEAVAVVQGLAGLQILLDGRPLLHLTSIREQHAEDGALLGCLLNAEQGLAGHPAVGYCLVVGLALTLANNHVETVVAQVASLSGTLDAIADDGDDLVLQYFTCFLE